MIASLRFYLKHPWVHFSQTFFKSLNKNGILARPEQEQPTELTDSAAYIVKPQLSKVSRYSGKGTVMPEEMKTAWPEHYRYIDTIGPEGLEVHCITYTVIGETDQCYYIGDQHTVDMVNGFQ